MPQKKLQKKSIYAEYDEDGERRKGASIQQAVGQGEADERPYDGEVDGHKVRLRNGCLVLHAAR